MTVFFSNYFFFDLTLKFWPFFDQKDRKVLLFFTFFLPCPKILTKFWLFLTSQNLVALLITVEIDFKLDISCLTSEHESSNRSSSASADTLFHLQFWSWMSICDSQWSIMTSVVADESSIRTYIQYEFVKFLGIIRSCSHGNFLQNQDVAN